MSPCLPIGHPFLPVPLRPLVGLPGPPWGREGPQCSAPQAAIFSRGTGLSVAIPGVLLLPPSIGISLESQSLGGRALRCLGYPFASWFNPKFYQSDLATPCLDATLLISFDLPRCSAPFALLCTALESRPAAPDAGKGQPGDGRKKALAAGVRRGFQSQYSRPNFWVVFNLELKVNKAWRSYIFSVYHQRPTPGSHVCHLAWKLQLCHFFHHWSRLHCYVVAELTACWIHVVFFLKLLYAEAFARQSCPTWL